MRDYARLSADYASYHKTLGNRRAHMIGIPLIVFAVVRLSMVGPFPLAALALPVYFLWSRRLGWVMTAFIGLCAAGGAFITARAALAILVAGWMFQIYGHAAHEKNRPALLDNLLHALVGPAFVAEKLLESC